MQTHQPPLKAVSTRWRAARGAMEKIEPSLAAVAEIWPFLSDIFGSHCPSQSAHTYPLLTQSLVESPGTRKALSTYGHEGVWDSLPSLTCQGLVIRSVGRESMTLHK